jgi:hypothetical protein
MKEYALYVGKKLNLKVYFIGYHKYCSCKCRTADNADVKTRIMNKYGTVRHTNDLKIKETKNKLTLEKYNNEPIVYKNGKVINYTTHLVTYHCNKCNADYEYKRPYFQHRIYYYNMNPCRICQNAKLDFNQCSNEENDLYEFIKRNTSYNIIRHYKLSRKELDIYIPDLKLAFEFDGTYWHMDPRIYKETDINKVKNNTAKELWDMEVEKIKICNELKINCYIITEIDWLSDQENVKSRILNYIKQNKDKYGTN